jgi:hypothetical protein
MPRQSNDPIKTGTRKAKARRRNGVGAACTNCGESRPQALVTRSRPKLCYQCYEQIRGRKPTEPHHWAGHANSTVTVRVPSNDHRAMLSEAQREWPPTTLRNVDGSPLLALAAWLRGAADFIEDLIVRSFRRCADFVEEVEAWLREKHGDQWWIGSPFEGWQPG